MRVADTVGCPTDQGSQALLDCLQGLDERVIVPVHRTLRVSAGRSLSVFDFSYDYKKVILSEVCLFP